MSRRHDDGTMPFDLAHAIAVLERTPDTLRSMLAGLPEAWTASGEGRDSWSPTQVVGHLLDGEDRDWIPRTRIILAASGPRRFEPFDRFRHLEAYRNTPLEILLERFAARRRENLAALRRFELGSRELELTGEHPEFGTVTLRQLLATWVAHDLGHIVQIARVMARRYRDEAGPWRAYLSVLRD